MYSSALHCGCVWLVSFNLWVTAVQKEKPEQMLLEPWQCETAVVCCRGRRHICSVSRKEPKYKKIKTSENLLGQLTYGILCHVKVNIYFSIYILSCLQKCILATSEWLSMEIDALWKHSTTLDKLETMSRLIYPLISWLIAIRHLSYFNELFAVHRRPFWCSMASLGVESFIEIAFLLLVSLSICLTVCKTI